MNHPNTTSSGYTNRNRQCVIRATDCPAHIIACVSKVSVARILVLGTEGTVGIFSPFGAGLRSVRQAGVPDRVGLFQRP